MENKFGQLSKLNLTASQKGGKTILSDVSFTAPFKVMRPFYEKKGVMSVMMLTASAGIMAGDRQEFDITVKRGASMEVLSQAYDKIHRMEEGWAERNTLLKVEADAALRYTPLPVIPFGGSDYRSDLTVHLEDASSKLIYSDLLTAGRIAHEESFLYRKYVSKVRIYQGETLIYRDNTRYEPEEMDLPGFGFYEGFTHLGTLLFINVKKDDAWMQQVRELLDETEHVEGGVTRTAQGHVVVKMLGTNGDQLVKLQQRMIENVNKK